MYPPFFQALTKGYLVPGVASSFACVFLLGASVGGAEGGDSERGLGPVELKKKKGGVRGEGWGQEQELPKVRASYCCNPL